MRTPRKGGRRGSETIRALVGLLRGREGASGFLEGGGQRVFGGRRLWVPWGRGGGSVVFNASAVNL